MNDEARGTKTAQETPSSSAGIAYAVGAYVVWGIVPVYWKAVGAIPPLELLAPRIVWTALLVTFILLVRGELRTLRPPTWSLIFPIFTAAILVAFNWCIFIYAVQSDQIIATSLGYYINPLVSILLGLVVLGERLRRAQTAAVLLAASGVAYFTIQMGSLPWISVALAVSFAFYGLVHKLRPQPPLVGLAREMIVLLPASALLVAGLASRGEMVLPHVSLEMQALVAASGIITATPLFLFRAATHHLPLVAIGMFQYIAPTLALGLAVGVFGEPFTLHHAVAFACVWGGLLIFTVDSIRQARAARSAQPNALPSTEP